MAEEPLTALDQFLCQAAETERPAGWNRRRGRRICGQVEAALEDGKTEEEAKEIAYRSMSGWLVLLLGKAIAEALVSWIVRKVIEAWRTGAVTAPRGVAMGVLRAK